jgi:UDP-glucuronate decarboxylase
MRHLVTGGSGFIGSHLIDRLMADVTAQVICVDNFQTGSKGNVAHWL